MTRIVTSGLLLLETLTVSETSYSQITHAQASRLSRDISPTTTPVSSHEECWQGGLGLVCKALKLAMVASCT